MRRFLLAMGIGMLACTSTQAAEDLVYKLPTDNDALYRGENEAYYMYCDRWFEGKQTQPWEAGTFGFTRNALRVHDGRIFFTKLHEGIDVKPIRRDANAEPLDDVRPIAPGIVAYTSSSPGASNYGRYVVIAHETKEGTIYSLYAHLKKVSCEVGQRVAYNDTIGTLGYSGDGINKVRAHCHLEICLMVHSEFHRFCPSTNKHGLFHGHNLIGINAADVLLACKDGKSFSIKQYFNTLTEHYRVRVPRLSTPDILLRHPFLYKGEWGKESPSLDIAFTAEGIPIGVYPCDTPIDKPAVISCRPMPMMQKNCTMNRLNGKSTAAYLTPAGETFINRFIWQESQEEAQPSSTLP